MNNKTLAIAIVVIIVVAAVAAGVYFATQNTGGGGSATPTPTASPSVSSASSLQFSVDIESGDAAGTYTYKAKNIGESTMKIRIDMSISGMDFVYIVNGEEQKSWTYMSGTWTENTDFTADWDSWGVALTGYKEDLANWTGSGDYTYSDSEGNSIKIYAITVNPTLEDSLFEPT